MSKDNFPILRMKNHSIWTNQLMLDRLRPLFSFDFPSAAVKLPQAYLSEERLVDLHTLVRALRQYLPTPVPAVADRRVGVGYAAEEHRPLVVELLLGLANALVHRHHRVVQVCKETEAKRGNNIDD